MTVALLVSVAFGNVAFGASIALVDNNTGSFLAPETSVPFTPAVPLLPGAGTVTFAGTGTAFDRTARCLYHLGSTLTLFLAKAGLRGVMTVVVELADVELFPAGTSRAAMMVEFDGAERLNGGGLSFSLLRFERREAARVAQLDGLGDLDWTWQRGRSVMMGEC